MIRDAKDDGKRLRKVQDRPCVPPHIGRSAGCATTVGLCVLGTTVVVMRAAPASHLADGVVAERSEEVERKQDQAGREPASGK